MQKNSSKLLEIFVRITGTKNPSLIFKKFLANSILAPIQFFMAMPNASTATYTSRSYMAGGAIAWLKHSFKNFHNSLIEIPYSNLPATITKC